MRVIAGKWRGTKLTVGRYRDLRPVTDRIKESLFGILRDEIENSRILDLFAGSGSFGIEALSRGAAFVLFCEKHPGVAATLRKNLERVRCPAERYEIVKQDVFRFIEKCFHKEQFDLVFADPPFRIQVGKSLLGSLSASGLLKRKGILVLRHHKNEDVPEKVAGFLCVRSKQYGDSIVKFYELSNENSHLSRNF